MKFLQLLGVLVAGLIVLAGCTPDMRVSNANVNASNNNTNTIQVPQGIGYRNTEYGFSLTMPSSLVSGSTTSYLLPDSWSALDDGTGSGTKLASFILQGSNEIISAGIRIGASSGSNEVQNCQQGPSYATSVMRTQEINGVTVAIIDLSDAAMNKYRSVSSYRVVKGNTCLVFDTFVSGSNADVYENPPSPAFTKEEAFEKLQATMSTLELE